MASDADFARLAGQVNDLRNQLRRISTAELRSTVTGAVSDINDLEADVLALEADSHSSHDHGALTGLGDDDHTQYHNDARAVTWHDADDHSALPEAAVTAHEAALTITESQISDLAHIPDDGYSYGGTVLYESTDTFDKADHPGLRAVVVEVQGPGGAAGGAATTGAGQASEGGGGGAGGWCRKFILAASLGTSETVTIGAAGTGSAGAAGSGGGTTSFGAHCSANGGAGGAAGGASSTGVQAAPGVGGSWSGGDWGVDGGAGQFGRVVASGWPLFHCTGGVSVMGKPAAVTNSFSRNGETGSGYGSGGNGGQNGQNQGTARAGGDGAPAAVWVHLYF